MELARVLREGGTVFRRMPVKHGMEKPPQKNWIQSKPNATLKLSTKTMGMPAQEARVVIKMAKGSALGSLYPPIELKKIPPHTTPPTGPVIAMMTKYMKETS